jgi:hypothetical protein
MFRYVPTDIVAMQPRGQMSDALQTAMSTTPAKAKGVRPHASNLLSKKFVLSMACSPILALRPRIRRPPPLGYSSQEKLGL